MIADLLGSTLVLVISVLLRFRFQKMRSISIVIISVLVGTFYTLTTSEEYRLLFDTLLFNSLVSLCAVWLVKISIKMKPNLIKMSNGYEKIES
ncbi:hypothetical protein SAMN05216389_101142 [Oceanobacillus limi]|uniref:Uncharacterized protein n=1 Tax=Oceanobacillus limi TaxID=930131 RepID=A0A1H9Y2E5_9BACI|nr:hypothetical protein SAMN05216389_101142 [Oceanobacillus limi]